MHPNTKSTRACFKASMHQSVLFDLSYYGLIQIQGNLQEIQILFKDITDPLDPSICHDRYVKGCRYGQTTAYSFQSYPLNPIGPIYFFWKSNSSAQEMYTIWIWIHPGILDSIMNLLHATISQLELTCLNVKQIHELSRFRLVGPRSHAILQHVLDTRVSKQESNIQVNVQAQEV